jgi:hypothetical protein
VSFEAAFLTMMPETIDVYPFLGFDTYGEPSYSTGATSYRARIEFVDTVVKDQLGKDVATNITAYMASTSRLSNLDRYIFPDGSTGIVQSISPVSDDEGIHHIEARFSG